MDGKATSRDARLDALRGLLLVIMAAVHVPTPLSHYLQEPFGHTSCAEGFIFLSAALAGLVYGRIQARAGWREMAARAWSRAKQVYLAHLAVLMPLAVGAWCADGRSPALANLFHDFLAHPRGSLLLLPLLLHQPPLFDILPLYVVFLAATPLLFALARRNGWAWVLLCSGTGWLAAQVHWGVRCAEDPSSLLPLRWGSFNLAAWQFLWVSGIVLGQSSWGDTLRRKCRFRAGVAAGVVVLAGLLSRHGLIPTPESWYLLMDKWTLGPLRALNFFAWVLLLLVCNPRLPARLTAAPALLGRHSLAVFSFHILAVILATAVLDCGALGTAGQMGIGLCVVAALFPMAGWMEHRRLRSIPRRSEPAPVAPAVPPPSTASAAVSMALAVSQ